MGRFNKEEFGNRIKEIRKSKGLSTENLAMMINKSQSIVSRYESGAVLPDAETITILCDALGITENDLFNSNDKFNNKDMSKNPFGVKTLYLYYRAFNKSKNKFTRGKFKLVIREKDNICKVDMMDYKTDKIYLSGHMLADSHIAIFLLENYKPNSPRLEVTEIILNISDCMDRLMFGTLGCTNGNYVPSIRKCIISKEDVEYDDKIEEFLKISDKDKEQLIRENVLHIDIENKDDYED